jgi:hypothetical protein
MNTDGILAIIEALLAACAGISLILSTFVLLIVLAIGREGSSAAAGRAACGNVARCGWRAQSSS